ncbi:hypothetical protein GCM10017752_00470 [Streptomyces roseoviridis]
MGVECMGPFRQRLRLLPSADLMGWGPPRTGGGARATSRAPASPRLTAHAGVGTRDTLLAARIQPGRYQGVIRGHGLPHDEVQAREDRVIGSFQLHDGVIPWRTDPAISSPLSA